jgi:hypothetical protein
MNNPLLLGLATLTAVTIAFPTSKPDFPTQNQIAQQEAIAYLSVNQAPYAGRVLTVA